MHRTRLQTTFRNYERIRDERASRRAERRKKLKVRALAWFGLVFCLVLIALPFVWGLK